MSAQVPRESLVQYEPAIEINNNSDLARIQNLGNKKKTQLPPLESKPSTEDILNAILPPREWDHDGTHYIQYVSHAPASREDVANLQKLLDERLLARQARDSGICPIREELHSQCFDEIIRQVTIDCPERGILLLRVRDELKMTIAAYQTLYQSSVTFGMRKQLQSEQGKADTEQKILELESRKSKLEERRQELINKKEAIEKKNKERKEIDDQKRKQEIEFLRYQSQHLESFLKTITIDLK
ncbi:hypothetical protein IMG5_169540 [Ichthyophthirius multifiliis]|uniref:Uncharacterized protein n=1 Tax=Ichthyophthirius multifiliis TaxID=5932 RepID=G0R1C4_ICHMU|nr:hypothetical protein IMG5_169540 [Ichthyophthirius multifiliis]EGR28757.1 hypothetical protein IMG5_169540 [Ichthyophthirius multifiliis]|eukprot:XP_004029993.1 hypothetical protein IMG5_169540 [Ichthyophthirius multifiliis]